MKTKKIWLLVLTLSEWLNWVAAGRLRLNNRVVQISCPSDADGFAAAMNHAPDVSFLDDGAFMLAELKPNWSEFQEEIESAPTSAVTWLKLESVEQFLPVSDRGSRLLTGDAHRAHVILGQPKFEAEWEIWRAGQEKIRSDWRGRAWVRAMRLMEPELDYLPKEVLPFLLGDLPLPNAGKTSRLESTHALAWANAFAVFGELAGQDEKAVQTETLKLMDLVAKLQTDYDMSRPVLFESPDLHTADELSQVLKQRLEIDLSIRLLVVVFHYLNILKAQKDISIVSLIKDLAILTEETGPKSAANAAYLIGRNMEDIPVTTLLYNSFFELFPSLTQSKLSPLPSISDFIKKHGENETGSQQANNEPCSQTSSKEILDHPTNVPTEISIQTDGGAELAAACVEGGENIVASEPMLLGTDMIIETKPAKKSAIRKKYIKNH